MQADGDAGGGGSCRWSGKGGNTFTAGPGIVTTGAPQPGQNLGPAANSTRQRLQTIVGGWFGGVAGAAAAASDAGCSTIGAPQSGQNFEDPAFVRPHWLQ